MRSNIVHIVHHLHRSGLIAGMDGNVSVRTDEGFLVTRSGGAKGQMTPADVVAILEDGSPASSDGHAPTSELPLHLACYGARPDVAAVIHAHPPHVVAASIAGVELAIDALPEAALILAEVPVVAYRRTGSAELADATAVAVRDHDVAILARHGAIAVGRTLDEALVRMETLEHSARILFIASQLGGAQRLTSEQLRELAAYRATLGL